MKLHHYEILNLKEYLISQNIEPLCQNVRPNDIPKLNCKNPNEYSIYRCQNFEDYVTGEISEEIKKTKTQLKQASDCLTEIVMGKSTGKTRQQIESVAKVLRKLAKEKLPELIDLPLELIDEFKATMPGKKIYPEQIPYYAMLSQSNMEISHHAEFDRKRADLFRKYKVYDYSPTKDFLIWSQIYLTSKGIEDQFTEYGN